MKKKAPKKNKEEPKKNPFDNFGGTTPARDKVRSNLFEDESSKDSLDIGRSNFVKDLSSEDSLTFLDIARKGRIKHKHPYYVEQGLNIVTRAQCSDMIEVLLLKGLDLAG